MISTRAHAYLDYLLGVLLVISPWLFNFAFGAAETWIPVIVGALLIIYSLLTDYDRSLRDYISFQTHLWLDGVLGIFLGISPWLLGFDELVFLPHLILGIIELGIALATVKELRAHKLHKQGDVKVTGKK